MGLNYKLIATNIGDLLKYDTTINEINRQGSAIFNFTKDIFPNENMTSTRSQEIYNWIMTLARQKMNNEERNKLLINFCEILAPENLQPKVKEILEKGGVRISQENFSGLGEFLQRNFHREIHIHCKKLYLNGHYFHAVFEACKAYNQVVKHKAKESEDGFKLMMKSLDTKGVLKLNTLQTDSERDFQNGIKFLSAGLMQAIRNPTAHEPAIDWPISKEDCLNILSFLSFLFNQLDKAVYYKI